MKNILNVTIPVVDKGYKYLGCEIKWRGFNSVSNIEVASEKILKKVARYRFRFGLLRNDLK